jgi:PKHD-type hydroxylase
MKGEWCYFKSHFNDEMCDIIINDCLAIPSQDALVGSGNGEIVDQQVRKTKVRFFNSNDWKYRYIFDEVWKMAVQANHDFFNVHITKLDFLQFGEYSEDQFGEYKEHHDVFWLNEDPIYHRKISMVIQLSDPQSYVGGDLQFTDCMHVPPEDELRMRGTSVFFPSFFKHRVLPVTRGTRYSLVAWFEGPKWR